MRIIGISGSLRQASVNSALLRAARAVAPDGVTVDIQSIAEFPVYSGDIEAVGLPKPVTGLAGLIAGADGVLISSPEYNYSVSGVLKNAIDWLSRCKPQPFARKPLAIMGASPGKIGTARMQHHLRQIMVCLDADIVIKPEMMVGPYGGLFDDDQKLVDEATQAFLVRLLGALAAKVG